MTTTDRAIKSMSLCCRECFGPLNACDCHYDETGLPDCAKGFFYRFEEMGESSNRFGPCEICDKYVSSVHTQVEFRFYLDPGTNKLAVTYADCRGIVFGHGECLKGLRKS